MTVSQISLALTDASLATVKIVPSVGFITDLYARATPVSSASVSKAVSASFLPAKAFEKPLPKISEVITPEFPLAPLKSADSITFATSPTPTPSPIKTSSFLALPRVIDIFVPVSPSGTGKTFNSSTLFLFLDMLLAALINASLKTLPLIISDSSPLYYDSIPSTKTLILFTAIPVSLSTTYLTLLMMLSTIAETFIP